MIKLFTMVKDEVDIIEDWILYHGAIFGFHNLYIVDNMSTDGTYELMQKYVGKGVNTIRQHDYKKKGDLMKQLISQLLVKIKLLLRFHWILTNLLYIMIKNAIKFQLII